MKHKDISIVVVLTIAVLAASPAGAAAQRDDLPGFS